MKVLGNIKQLHLSFKKNPKKPTFRIYNYFDGYNSTVNFIWNFNPQKLEKILTTVTWWFPGLKKSSISDGTFCLILLAQICRSRVDFFLDETDFPGKLQVAFSIDFSRFSNKILSKSVALIFSINVLIDSIEVVKGHFSLNTAIFSIGIPRDWKSWQKFHPQLLHSKTNTLIYSLNASMKNYPLFTTMSSLVHSNEPPVSRTSQELPSTLTFLDFKLNSFQNYWLDFFPSMS